MAKEAGVSRFIFASSCSIYGAAKNEMALDETAPVNPVSAYAVSKVRTEAVLSELAGHRFSPVFMRNATAYGVSPRLRFASCLITSWPGQKLRGQITKRLD